MELNCFISSQKDQKSTDDCRLEKQKTYLYKLSYQNKRCKTFFDIANFLYRAINCSAKQCSREELAKNEEQAHKEHCILVSDVKQVPRIEEIALEV